MPHSTKTKPKSPAADSNYPIGRRRTALASEPLTDEERAAVDAYYQNESEEDAESVSAEELMARLRRR